MMKLASSLVRTSRQVQPSPILAQCFHSNTKKPRQPSLASTIKSVVKIFSISRTVDPLHPWAAFVSESSVGSGFVISHRRIITNAHVVTGAKFVDVMKLQSGTKYRAEITAFGHECDLAILHINNDQFWNDLEPLNLVERMPSLLETVIVAGYPEGGDNISLTKGVISRIDVDVYSHNNRSPLSLPRLQVDAAINAGNSGGPVFLGSEVVGVAFEGLEGGDNIGYVIPSPIVSLFLESVEKEIVGFCSLGLCLQPMENAMMRKYFGMNEDMTGTLVNNIDRLSQANKGLKVNDVILEVDGFNLEDDGKVLYENRFWIHLDGFIALKKPEGQLSIKVLRRGNIKIINLKSMPIDNWSITDYPSPSYYIFAGLVFTECIDGAVKISQVLEDQINEGYTPFSDLEVRSCNGKTVNSLQDLCEMIKASTGYVRIELQDDSIVLVDLSIHKECHDKLLQDHKVMSGMSEDIREFFQLLEEEKEESD